MLGDTHAPGPPNGLHSWNLPAYKTSLKSFQIFLLRLTCFVWTCRCYDGQVEVGLHSPSGGVAERQQQRTVGLHLNNQMVLLPAGLLLEGVAIVTVIYEWVIIRAFHEARLKGYPNFFDSD
jgi:hypothetical protein